MKSRTSPARDGYTAITLAPLALGTLLASLGVSMANIALPEIAENFQASFPTIQWVVVAYVLALTIASVATGWLGDQWGHKSIILAGFAGFALAAAGSAIAPTLEMLIATRAIQGISAAALMTLSMALAREIAGPDRAGRVMGLLGTMSAVGTAAGPSLGGLLIATGGWRLAFSMLAPMAIVSLLMAARFLPAMQRQYQRRASNDWLGLALLASTLGLYALSMTWAGDLTTTLAMGIGSALALTAFIVAEARSPSPLLDPARFRNLPFSLSLATNTVVAMVMMATLLIGPFYLTTALALSQFHMGLVMSIGPIISMMSGIPSGWAVDRYGSTVMTIVGLTAAALGCLALAVLPGHCGIAGYIAAVAMLTPGYQLFQAANNTQVMKDAISSERGLISGVLALSRNIGLISGASTMGAIFVLTSGADSLKLATPSQVERGMNFTFLLGALAIMVSAILHGVAVLLSRKRVSAAAAPSNPAQG